MARKAVVSPVDQSNCDCCSCAKKKRNGQCRLVMVAVWRIRGGCLTEVAATGSSSNVNSNLKNNGSWLGRRQGSMVMGERLLLMMTEMEASDVRKR